MFSLLSYAIFGLIAGAIARLLHPGRDPMGWLWTMVLGIGGAVLGGWIGTLMGFNANEGLMSWVFAVLGSIALLFIYHSVTRRTLKTGGGSATTDDYKSAVFGDLKRGPPKP